MTDPQVTIGSVARLVASLGVAGAGLIAVVPQPTAFIWQASVILGEAGYWLAVPAALLLLRWRRSAVDTVARVVTLAGIGLLVTPVVMGLAVGRTLPDRLTERFGTPAPPSRFAGAARRAPLSVGALLTGISSANVIVDEHVYPAADGSELRLDLYRPEFAEGALPIVIVIHGGAWSRGSKRDLAALNEYLAARDHAVAAISYRLAPTHPFPAAQEDVASAIAYVRSLAGTHAVDPDRIALIGRSAGGQIALLAGYAGLDPAIRGVVAFYAPTALRWGHANPAPPAVIDSSLMLEQYLGGPPATHGARYDAAEPARLVTETSPPTLLIQGLRDELVSPFHAEFVSARLLEAGVPHYVLRMPWAAHGCDYVFRGPCGQISTFAVERFLRAVLVDDGTPPARRRPAEAGATAPGTGRP